MIQSVKTLLQSIPAPAGRLLSRFPYAQRPFIGRPYRRCQRLIADSETWSSEQTRTFVFSQVKRVIQHAYQRIPFYRRLYDENRFSPDRLRSFDDIERVPVIDKAALQAVPLRERSTMILGRYLANTGGTSGSPLHFYITPDLIPSEWGHMHWVWRKLGYTERDLKLGFGGRNLGKDNVVYDGLRHQYVVSLYREIDRVASDLLLIARSAPIRYLHGYPSAIYEFARFCEKEQPELLRLLRASLRGALLGSEFPVREWRERIESVFGIPSVSWYGHTERAVLAWEKGEPFEYHPFQTYGYCEVKRSADGFRLIGTSYRNLASPLIRYDTGDDVEPLNVESGLLRSFRIRNGRVGDFVVDRNGVKIPLTALIFGRHHDLFNIAKFVQVRQRAPGHMEVLATLERGAKTPSDWNRWFDTSGLEMTIDFCRLNEPILTPRGKVALRVEAAAEPSPAGEPRPATPEEGQSR